MPASTRRSIRLSHYDYASPGAYFVTICAYQRRLLFERTEVRETLLRLWLEIPDHDPNAAVDCIVVMPNHVHGIVFINETPVGAQPAAPWPVPGHLRAQQAAPLRSQNVQPGSLGAIVRSFKAAATRTLRTQALGTEGPLWQRNYYERVIRDEDELERVREYILNNPLRWQLDRENPDRTVSAAYERDWAWLEGDAGA